MARHTAEITFETATASGEAGRALQSTLEEAIGRWISGETGYQETHDAFIGRVLDAVRELTARARRDHRGDLGRGHRRRLRPGARAARRALARPGPAARQRQHHKVISGQTGTHLVTFNDHAHLESDRALITYR